MAGRKWRAGDVNLVGKAAKQRAVEDRARADAYRADRLAQIEAIVNKTYDGMENPKIRALYERLTSLAAPLIEEFNQLVAEEYPAEFSRPRLLITLIPGGIPPDFREQIRRDAAVHINARHRYMLANSSTVTTEVLNETFQRGTDNPEVKEILGRLAVPNRATPTLEPPGPAIGILRRLLPNPEEWGLDGYREDSSALLPKPATERRALPPPESGDSE